MKLRYYLRGLGIGMLVTSMILILAADGKENLSDEEIRARAAQLGMIESSSLTLAEMQNMQGNQNQMQESQAGVSESTAQESQTGASEGTVQESQTGVSEGTAQESQPAEGENTSQESQAGAGEGTAQESQSAEGENTSQESQAGAGEGTTQESQPTEGENPSQESQSAQEQEGTQDNQTESSAGIQTFGPKVEDGIEIVEITIPGGASSGAVSRQLANVSLVEDAREFDNYLCNNGYSRRIRVGTFKIPIGSSWQEIADIISTK